MQLSDLMNVADLLPDTGQDHRYNILKKYEKGSWGLVNDYIDEVMVTSAIQPRTETLIAKGYHLLSKVKEVLKGIKLRDIR